MPRAPDEPRRKRARVQTDADSRSVDGETHDDDGGPACQSCRRRKSRCSKQQPCGQCERLQVECTYDERRRPGFKTGAIESLSQRLTTLEHMFLGQTFLLKSFLEASNTANGRAQSSPILSASTSLGAQMEQLKAQCLEAACLPETVNGNAGPSGVPPKGIRSDAVDEPATDQALPSEDTLHDLVEWYFGNVHRWIPILHLRRFRAKLACTEERGAIHIILLAIASLSLRFCRPIGMSEADAQTTSIRYRHAVMLRSMECFSVESLQALVILAFDIVGSGQGPTTWSIIGSMARTVEHLRLNTEPATDPMTSQDTPDYLIRRMTFLKQARTWVEEEERRRLFWSVFMMDRFCSVATGWNNSLTGADVRRRLPCEGSIWAKETPVKTPFFGAANAEQVSTPSSERMPVEGEEVEAVGGFSFCIEATDTLNLVTNFFLQRAIKFEGLQQVRMWLMRFKELDLRLVKWRLSLPEKWREASVLNQDGIMDPNLTLAHITHNTAVIQLHQCVAFPPPPLRTSPVALPSASSAETCITAAYEIGTIAQQFLQQSTGITHPQFAFCLFIAGRVLLAHAAHNASSVHTAFTTLSAALQEISARWNPDGHRHTDESIRPATKNLASRLSSRLLHAQATLHSNTMTREKRTTLDIGRPVYFEEGDRSRAASVVPERHNGNAFLPADADRERTAVSSLDPIASAIPNLHSLWGEDANLLADYDPGLDFMNMDEAGMSEIGMAADMNIDWSKSLEGLLGSDFQQMPRVSTYHDAHG